MSRLPRHSFWKGPIRDRRKSLIAGGLGTFVLAAAGTVYLDAETYPRRPALPPTVTACRDARVDGKSVEQFALARSNPVDRRLHEHELTSSPGGSSGITRYDVAQLACANPSEDDHAEAVLPVPTGSWTFFAVLDGHSGWETSAWLRNNLIPASVGALVDLYHSFKRSNSTEEPQPPPESISQTLKQTFRQLDDDIVHEPLERVFRSLNPRTDAVNLLAPAHAGSCALLAFYDSYSRLLHVALTGDSRAVLGRRVVSDSGNVSYEVHVLSMDQNGNNLAEEARLNAEHPGETVVKNGRVLGMGMSRAFGDARYKWDRAIQMKLKEACMGRSVLRDIKTPPYLTAEPEVTSFEVQPGDFLILATDGLWEALTNDDAVGLVGWWRNSEQPSGVARSGPLRPAELPVIRKELSTDELSSYHSVRYGQWGAKKSFIRRDENAATHLIRNAIGGADKDLVTSILSMRPPRARTYIDDLTVTVVFFAETSPTRELTSV